MQSQCDDCGGTGDFIREKDRCKKCKGKRLVEREHKIEVSVEGVKQPVFMTLGLPVIQIRN